MMIEIQKVEQNQKRRLRHVLGESNSTRKIGIWGSRKR